MTKQTKTLLMAGGAAALAYYLLKGQGTSVPTPVASGNYLMVGDGDPICPKAGPLRCGKMGGAIAFPRATTYAHARRW